jgi:hypothetical protein
MCGFIGFAYGFAGPSGGFALVRVAKAHKTLM